MSVGSRSETPDHLARQQLKIMNDKIDRVLDTLMTFKDEYAESHLSLVRTVTRQEESLKWLWKLVTWLSVTLAGTVLTIAGYGISQFVK